MIKRKLAIISLAVCVAISVNLCADELVITTMDGTASASFYSDGSFKNITKSSVTLKDTTASLTVYTKQLEQVTSAQMTMKTMRAKEMIDIVVANSADATTANKNALLNNVQHEIQTDTEFSSVLEKTFMVKQNPAHHISKKIASENKQYQELSAEKTALENIISVLSELSTSHGLSDLHNCYADKQGWKGVRARSQALYEIERMTMSELTALASECLHIKGLHNIDLQGVALQNKVRSTLQKQKVFFHVKAN